MDIVLKEENNELVMYFEGRLDTASAPEAEKAVAPLKESTGHNIIIDCSKLDYISSAGLRIFLSVLKSAKPKGDHVYIRGISDSIRAVFAMTGFVNLFEFR